MPARSTLKKRSKVARVFLVVLESRLAASEPSFNYPIQERYVVEKMVRGEGKAPEEGSARRESYPAASSRREPESCQ